MIPNANITQRGNGPYGPLADSGVNVGIVVIRLVCRRSVLCRRTVVVRC